MNEQIKEVAVKAKLEHCVSHVRLQDFADKLINKAINGIAVDTANWKGEYTMAYYQGVQDAVKSIQARLCTKEQS